MAPHWFGGYVSSFSPQGFLFVFSYPAVFVTSFSCRIFVAVIIWNVSSSCLPSEAKGNQNKPNGLYLSDVYWS